LFAHSYGIWLTGNGQGDVSFDESLFFYFFIFYFLFFCFFVLFWVGVAFPCDGHFFVFAFMSTCKIKVKLYMLFFGLVMGAKRSIARDHDRQHALLIWI
jgi:hypothetical protein